MGVSGRAVNRRQVGLACVAVLGLVAACGGAATPPPSSQPSQGAASPAATSSAVPSGLPSPEASGLEVVDFDVTGSLAGQTVAGKTVHTTLTIACAGAGSDQILTVRWQGETDASHTALQGEIDFKPGTWSLGSSSAQGTATIGLAGGKPADSLVGTSGTVTTGSSGGTIDGVFGGGPGQLNVSGSWTCPTH